MATTKGGVLAARKQAQMQQGGNSASESLATMMNSLISREGFRKRFDELLGKRAPQFISSVVTLMNADTSLKQAFAEAPVTIIQSALKAASYDLPIDPALGYAYIVPFRNSKKGGIHEAQFIMGYKGMIQLALRSGCYRKINVLDVRAGELKSYDRLTEDIEFEWIADEDQRESAPVIGYVGYFQLVNGMEKTIYMTVKQLEAHEKKYRQGQYMGKGWRDDPDAMMRKTVLRRLIGKWGIMSVTYQNADPAMMQAAAAIANGSFDDEDNSPIDVTAASVEANTHSEEGKQPSGEVTAQAETPAPEPEEDPAIAAMSDEMGDWYADETTGK